MLDILRLGARVLFLSEDPALIKAQIDGRDLSRAEAGKLRDDVSTDEMTPPTTCLLYDERLGAELLIGLRTGERNPIAKGALNGVFSVIVAGRRYGKGSSREHAPLAHLHAGVRLIVAESFERIFRQNADNLGLFTSTDFSLIERVPSPGARVPARFGWRAAQRWRKRHRRTAGVVRRIAGALRLDLTSSRL